MSKEVNSRGMTIPVWSSKVSRPKITSVKQKEKFSTRTKQDCQDSGSSSDYKIFLQDNSKQSQQLKNTPATLDKSLLCKFKNISEGGWPKSARQRELIRTGSSSSLPGSDKEHSVSALQNNWPSTARNRQSKDSSKTDWAGSAKSRELQISDLNIRCSAGSNRTIESGIDLLVESVRLGRTRQIKLLLEGGSNPNIPNHQGVTPLIAAVCDNANTVVQTSLIHLLLEAGADPNIGDYNGTTPLMHAASINCHHAAVSILQHKNTDPGLQNNDGSSSLMLAASHGYMNIVLLILAAFKNVHHVTYLGQRNWEGLTAFDQAEQKGHFHVSSLLRENNSKVGRPHGIASFITHTHQLSRSPTPTNTSDCSELQSDDFETDTSHDHIFRPPTVVSEEDSHKLDLLSLNFDQELSLFDNINNTEVSSSPGSGNEADTESLMDQDNQLLTESDLCCCSPPQKNMASLKVKSDNSSVGISKLPFSEKTCQQSLKGSSSCNAFDKSVKVKEFCYPFHTSGDSNKKETENETKQFHSQILNSLAKVSTDSSGNEMQILVDREMPKIVPQGLNKLLNKSIQSLVNEDQEMRPRNRPPTPARPSLPNLLSEKYDCSTDSTSSTETTERIRRVTLSNLQRPVSDPKTLSISASQKTFQNEEEFVIDILDSSTKSEGWDALWGQRGHSTLLHSEGHVVPLPPIVHSSVAYKSKKLKKLIKIGEGREAQSNSLYVGKKLRQNHEVASFPEEKTLQRKKLLR